jgi:mRNA-degrading endonuclease toxin of MazEF toxin-antitoxin module
MERGDIYPVSLDSAFGHEQQGRPVLVVSPAAFDRVSKAPIVLPITSGGNFARMAGFAVSLMGAGLQTTGIVRCDQPRVLDLVTRNGRKLEPCRAGSWMKCWRGWRRFSSKTLVPHSLDSAPNRHVRIATRRFIEDL